MDKTRISRFMCRILRHEPGAIGITIDKHAWADVDLLIAGVQRHMEPAFDRSVLEDIVATDDKQRYSFSPDGTRIRANQGHSIPVDLGLTAVRPPEYLWHGTSAKYMDSIDRIGLIPKSRQYVHMSANRETAHNVGERHLLKSGEDRVLIYRVHSGEMARDGYEIYCSVNGVWLTDAVPVRYLEKEE